MSSLKKKLQPASRKNLEIPSWGPPFSLNMTSTLDQAVGVGDMNHSVDAVETVDMVDTVDLVEPVAPETSVSNGSGPSLLVWVRVGT
jgi:hypothetical protein